MTVTRTTETRPLTGAGSPASQQVSWWPTHEFITELVANVNNLPVAGTPAWCARQSLGYSPQGVCRAEWVAGGGHRPTAAMTSPTIAIAPMIA